MLFSSPDGKKEDHQSRTKHLLIVVRKASDFVPACCPSNDSLGFTKQIEKPDGEGQVQRYEKAEADGKRVKGDWQPANGIERFLCKKIANILLSNWKFRNNGKEKMCPVDQIDETRNCKPNPQQTISPKIPTRCHCQRQLDNWITELFPFNPLFPQNRVDTQKNKQDDKVKQRPPNERSEPGSQMGRKIKTGFSLIVAP